MKNTCRLRCWPPPVLYYITDDVKMWWGQMRSRVYTLSQLWPITVQTHSNIESTAIKGVSFERNCGAASVGVYNKVIRYYHLLIMVDSASCTRLRVSNLTKVDNANWPPLRVSKLTFRALALRHSLWRRTNARNVSLETINGDQFKLSTQLIIPNDLVRINNICVIW